MAGVVVSCLLSQSIYTAVDTTWISDQPIRQSFRIGHRGHQTLHHPCSIKRCVVFRKRLRPSHIILPSMCGLEILAASSSNFSSLIVHDACDLVIARLWVNKRRTQKSNQDYVDSSVKRHFRHYFLTISF